MRNLTAQPDSKLIILFVKGGAIAKHCAANRKITRAIFHTDDLGHDLAGLSETVMNIPTRARASNRENEIHPRQKQKHYRHYQYE